MCFFMTIFSLLKRFLFTNKNSFCFLFLQFSSCFSKYFLFDGFSSFSTFFVFPRVVWISHDFRHWLFPLCFFHWVFFRLCLGIVNEKSIISGFIGNLGKCSVFLVFLSFFFIMFLVQDKIKIHIFTHESDLVKVPVRGLSSSRNKMFSSFPFNQFLGFNDTSTLCFAWIYLLNFVRSFPFWTFTSKLYKNFSHFIKILNIFHRYRNIFTSIYRSVVVVFFCFAFFASFSFWVDIRCVLHQRLVALVSPHSLVVCIAQFLLCCTRDLLPSRDFIYKLKVGLNSF